MIKLPPHIKVGCPRCKYDLERLQIKDVKELSFLIDENAQSSKQTTLNPKKTQPSSKVVSLF